MDARGVLILAVNAGVPAGAGDALTAGTEHVLWHAFDVKAVEQTVRDAYLFPLGL